jgi:hypothetical protein
MNFVREPDAGNPPVRFDEREVKTEHGRRLLRHKRGNPETEVIRSLNHRVTSRLYHVAADAKFCFLVVGSALDAAFLSRVLDAAVRPTDAVSNIGRCHRRTQGAPSAAGAGNPHGWDIGELLAL